MPTDVYQRVCKRCRTPFETERGNRTNCYTCAPERVYTKQGSVSPIRALPDAAPVPAMPQTPPTSVPTPPAGELEKVVLKELEALNWLDTIEGRLCQSLARELDSPEVTGASRTSMTKQLAYMISQIRDSAPGEPDAIDDARDKVRRIRLGEMDA